ncbi:energy transducer TonB [Sphingobacterium faecale]|uniref:Energy transducer TonB n=1 Tax=Sphingobacterium faecale TaxID=2803775 RepID=A0ABS1R9C9_9SPHI|nr:energy transducer TonB [Sphingobacterium faecale]MBL1411319.1 energy transducer TonB [Sphingobacterium faecale]
MLFSKSVIFNKEWMDVVFVDRNKAYGAYQLRLFGDKAIGISLGGVILFVGALCSLSFIYPKKSQGVESDLSLLNASLITVEIEKSEPASEEIVILKESGVAQQVAQDVPAVDLIKFTEVNPTNKASLKEDIVETSETLGARKMIAAISMKGQAGGALVPKGTFGKEKRNGGALGKSMGSDIEGRDDGEGTFETVEIMPEPPGGMKAFVEWVARNYQFPSSAVDHEVAGLIQVSFVVERDGRLSSFEVKRDLGFGTGNQAIELLKRAKRWTLGIQNGRPVRVSYNLPIRLSTVQQ